MNSNNFLLLSITSSEEYNFQSILEVALTKVNKEKSASIMESLGIFNKSSEIIVKITKGKKEDENIIEHVSFPIICLKSSTPSSLIFSLPLADIELYFTSSVVEKMNQVKEIEVITKNNEGIGKLLENNNKFTMKNKDYIEKNEKKMKIDKNNSKNMINIDENNNTNHIGKKEKKKIYHNKKLDKLVQNKIITIEEREKYLKEMIKNKNKNESKNNINNSKSLLKNDSKIFYDEIKEESTMVKDENFKIIENGTEELKKKECLQYKNINGKNSLSSIQASEDSSTTSSIISYFIPSFLSSTSTSLLSFPSSFSHAKEEIEKKVNESLLYLASPPSFFSTSNIYLIIKYAIVNSKVSQAATYHSINLLNIIINQLNLNLKHSSSFFFSLKLLSYLIQQIDKIIIKNLKKFDVNINETIKNQIFYIVILLKYYKFSIIEYYKDKKLLLNKNNYLNNIIENHENTFNRIRGRNKALLAYRINSLYNYTKSLLKSSIRITSPYIKNCIDFYKSSPSYLHFMDYNITKLLIKQTNFFTPNFIKNIRDDLWNFSYQEYENNLLMTDENFKKENEEED